MLSKCMMHAISFYYVLKIYFLAFFLLEKTINQVDPTKSTYKKEKCLLELYYSVLCRIGLVSVSGQILFST